MNLTKELNKQIRKKRNQLYKTKDIQKQALLIIEDISADDFIGSLEMKLATRPDRVSEETQKLLKKIEDIYRFAHCVSKNACYRSHQNWRVELKSRFKALQIKEIKGGI